MKLENRLFRMFLFSYKNDWLDFNMFEMINLEFWKIDPRLIYEYRSVANIGV